MILTIRPATITDLEQINQIYNHYVNHTAITFDLVAWTLSQRQQWHRELTQSVRYQVFVACHGGSIVGFAYNGQYHSKAAYQDSTEVTVYAAPDNVIKGVGRSLYQQLINHIDQQGFHRAYALITTPNSRSLSLHHQYGFKQIGLMSEVGSKFGSYHDVALLELTV